MDSNEKGVINLISLKELANKLGVKESWIYQRTRTNEIPLVRVGKYLRFNEEEVLGRPFDPMWVDVRDAAQAFSLALGASVQRSRLNVFHISSGNPDARFPVSKAKKGLSYQPEHDFREVSQ